TAKATRLTRGEGREDFPRFSPDGKWIAFSGEYGGMQDVYVVPVSGGAPRQVTFQNDYARMLDWSADGKALYYRSRNVPRSFALYRIPVDGGFPVKMPLEVLSSASWAPDGSRFVFTRLLKEEAWFRYKGGRKNDLWVGDEKALSFKKIVSTPNTNEYPVWTEKGICYVEDEDGKFSIKSVNADGSSGRRLVGPHDFEIRFLNTDGKRLIYERGVGLEVYDLATGNPQTVKMELASDLMQTLPFMVSADAQMMAGNIGPTGRRVLVETRGQIVSLPAKEGDARVLLAKDGVRHRFPTYSPDGKKIAYFSDETREMQLYVADADGSNPKQLTKDANRQLVRMQWSPDSKRIGFIDSNTKLRLINIDGTDERHVMTGIGWNGPNFDFSPDSKWIVYQGAREITYFGFLGLYEIATAKHTHLGTGMHDDSVPTFSSDGKYIAFISSRNINPRNDPLLDQVSSDAPGKAYLLPLSRETRSPLLPEAADEGSAKPEEKKPEGVADVRIDLEGLYERFVEVPVPPASYSKIAVIGDRIILQAENTTSFYDLKARRGGTVTSGGGWFDVSDDKKKLLIGPKPLRVLDVTAENVNATDGSVNWGNLQLTINPVKEWENMYWDGWRLLRDYFYVENMHGVDWVAIGKKYAKYLPLLRSRYELSELLRWLQAELNTSHMYLEEGDVRRLTKPAAPGYLGVDLEPGPNGYYRISKIFRGDGFNPAEVSPLAAPGLNVKEGDYLIEVAGRPARVGENFMQGLVNRAGQVVSVKVNDRPSPEG
ncbi:MAG TPA: PDZ domain-containing protein, partial [Fimbriimonadaceae bacterium]|nr:PDZ domain-containing protein [Fimbriimonadaceae bacterium]